MIDVVIVNWNAGVQLKECINSVVEHGDAQVSRIIVVDNGSTDGSADTIAGLPRVEIIRAGKNLGFGAACNIGAKIGCSPYILFLNPDTRIEANSISVPLAFMEKAGNSKVGVCGIQLVDEQGEVSRSCAYFPTINRFLLSALGLDKLPMMKGSSVHMSDWNHLSSKQVDHVMGAFYLIRRQLFQKVNGFDERFFVYSEDVDLSKLINNAGFSSWYLVEAKAFHAGGGTSQQVKAHRLFYSLRSRLLYGFKHFPAWQAWLLVLVTLLIEPFTRSIWCLLSRDLVGVKHTWAAYRMLWGSLKYIIQGNGRYNP